MAFTYRQKIKFRHCDPAGIVFYPRFFEMTNDTVEAFFEQELDFPFSQMHQASGIGRSSLDLSYHAVCGTEERFSATSTIVFIDAQGASTPWPDHIRSRLETHL